MALMSKKELSKLKKHMAEYVKLKKENTELKAMLKTVADDIEKFRNVLAENNCRLPCEKCLLFNDGKDECVYKYMGEIKKLIGSDDNAVTDKN